MVMETKFIDYSPKYRKTGDPRDVQIGLLPSFADRCLFVCGSSLKQHFRRLRTICVSLYLPFSQGRFWDDFCALATDIRSDWQSDDRLNSASKTVDRLKRFGEVIILQRYSLLPYDKKYLSLIIGHISYGPGVIRKRRVPHAFYRLKERKTDRIKNALLQS